MRSEFGSGQIPTNVRTGVCSDLVSLTKKRSDAPSGQYRLWARRQSHRKQRNPASDSNWGRGRARTGCVNGHQASIHSPPKLWRVDICDRTVTQLRSLKEVMTPPAHATVGIHFGPQLAAIQAIAFRLHIILLFSTPPIMRRIIIQITVAFPLLEGSSSERTWLRRRRHGVIDLLKYTQPLTSHLRTDHVFHDIDVSTLVTFRNIPLLFVTPRY